MKKAFTVLGLLLIYSLTASANKLLVKSQAVMSDTIPEVKLVSLDTTGNTIVTDNELVFEKVEEEADFKGGVKGWINFLEHTLNGDVPARKNAPFGKYTVIVQFIVNKKGKISEIKALTCHGFGMEKEVIRVMKKSPDWVPAMQNGRPVNAYRKQPITFVVSAS